MFRFLIAAALLASASAECEQLQVNYQLPAPRGSTMMDVSICPEENTIFSSVKDSEDFEGLEILEDFDVGFGATRVDDQESCYIRKLSFTTLEEQADALRVQPSPMAIEQAVELISVPADDVDEFGERISAFCGDLPAYKIGVSDEDDTFDNSRQLVPLTDASERIIALKFVKCCLLFLLPLCTTTTLTFPTGITLSFFWFFG